MTEISFNVVEVQKLELQRGDILVVKLPKDASPEGVRCVHEGMEVVMRRADITGVQVVVGRIGDEFSIIRKDEAA